MHESLDEFKFWSNTTTNSRVICLCTSEKLIYNVCEHSSAYIFDWIFFIFAGNKENQQSLDRVWILARWVAELRPLIDVRNWFLYNILRMDGQYLTKFCKHIIIDKIYFAIVKLHFSQICNRVTALDFSFRNWFLLNILRMDWQNLTKFCIHFIIDKIYVWIVKGHFLQICNGVTALDWCKKLFFAQYLENG